MLRITGNTVWVAVSRYSLEDDVEPLVAVGANKATAEAALDLAVRSHNEETDGTELRERWIDEPAQLLTVFDDGEAGPTDRQALLAIHALLDGEERNADTLDEVVAILRQAGLPVRDTA